MLPDHPTMEEMEAFFSGDHFATQAAGCRIVEGWKGHAVAEMDLATPPSRWPISRWPSPATSAPGRQSTP